MYTACVEIDSDVDVCCVRTETLNTENIYTTQPMLAIQPAYQQPNEEELHTSFEQAISERLAAVNIRLNRISVPLDVRRNTPARALSTSNKQNSVNLNQQQILATPFLPVKNTWQYRLVIGLLALALITIGFNLMGLLVLLAR